MNSRLAALVASVAAGVAFCATAGTGLADTTHFSGSLSDSGCGPVHSITVSSSSRIQASFATSAVSGPTSVQIVDQNGTVVSRSGAYDTPSGGTYGVRVCYQRDPQDEVPISYEGVIQTGPPGVEIKTQAEQVLGTSATVIHAVNGSGAIRTSSGLATFAVHTASDTGVTRVRFDDAKLRLHINATSGLHVAYGLNVVTITGKSLRIVLDSRGIRDRVTLQFHRVRAAGPVVRGGWKIL
jgi:hypothetical protein